MKFRHCLLPLIIVLFLSACTFFEAEPTTKFEDPNSVFAPYSVKDFVGTVIGYEETDIGTMMLIRDVKTDEVNRVLVMDESKFINGGREQFEARETGWHVSPVCDYNSKAFTDFYPGTRLYFVTDKEWEEMYAK